MRRVRSIAAIVGAWLAIIAMVLQPAPAVAAAMQAQAYQDNNCAQTAAPQQFGYTYVAVNQFGFVCPASPGSVGTDYSANKPTAPNVGANFGGSGTYANYVLVATEPASATRHILFAQNLSLLPCVLQLDDGTANSGSAPANVSYIALGAAAATGAQGGSTGPEMAYFQGRAQLYCSQSTAFFTLTSW